MNVTSFLLESSSFLNFRATALNLVNFSSFSFNCISKSTKQIYTRNFEMCQQNNHFSKNNNHSFLINWLHSLSAENYYTGWSPPGSTDPVCAVLFICGSPCPPAPITIVFLSQLWKNAFSYFNTGMVSCLSEDQYLMCICRQPACCETQLVDRQPAQEIISMISQSYKQFWPLLISRMTQIH